MLKSAIVRLVDACTRHAWPVIGLSLGLAVLSAVYVTVHFSIATDVKALFPADLAWTQRANRYLKTFPDYGILVVVEAPTSELADAATAKLTQAVAADRAHFSAVESLQSSAFFAREGLLYLPTEQVQKMAAGLGQAEPLVETLAADPSLRGALSALDFGLIGVANGMFPLDSLAPAMTKAGDTVDDVLAGQPAHFSWRDLADGSAPAGMSRRFIQVEPVLDYHSLQPGHAATTAISQLAASLDLSGREQATVRQTGLVPMDDAQFGTLSHHAMLNAAATVAAILVILWLALRSWRIIAAAAISLFCGLAMAAALGLLLVGTLNLISVAFFVLFIGLGVDFGIQFSVRYRAERHEIGDLQPALRSSARKAGGPLALAAAATAIGFGAFVPTSYRGLSELGEIAGAGMIVAFLTSITLLPALLQVMKPGAELRPMGFAALAPVDRFLVRHRIPVVVITLAVVGLASPLLYWLPFDFNPLHLQSPQAEAVATYMQLRRDPQTGANAIELIRPDTAAADTVAQQLSTLPEVASTRTLANFVPSDQQRKLAAIKQMATALGPALNQAHPKAPPTDGENVAALRSTSGSLTQFGSGSEPGAAAAKRLAGLLSRLAVADPAARQRAATAFVEPLRQSLLGLQAALNPQPVTLATLPLELKREWQGPNGEARIEVLPKGDPDDTAQLRRFVGAVLTVAPDATGPAVTLFEAGNTILHAFIEAGVLATIGIFALLWITLRRLSDVLVTLVPLLLAAVLTLELCVVFNLPLNFANVIALPLLLGLGVAFKIYYVTAWRRGGTALVQSTLSRAVIFSAMTTGTAFGSLWLSSNPGTASMGRLMALELICTMAAAVLFQPALMGPPRRDDAVEAETAEPAAAAAERRAVAEVFDPVHRESAWVVTRHMPRSSSAEAPPRSTEDPEHQMVTHDTDR